MDEMRSILQRSQILKDQRHWPRPVRCSYRFLRIHEHETMRNLTRVQTERTVETKTLKKSFQNQFDLNRTNLPLSICLLVFENFDQPNRWLWRVVDFHEQQQKRRRRMPKRSCSLIRRCHEGAAVQSMFEVEWKNTRGDVASVKADRRWIIEDSWWRLTNHYRRTTSFHLFCLRSFISILFVCGFYRRVFLLCICR